MLPSFNPSFHPSFFPSFLLALSSLPSSVLLFSCPLSFLNNSPTHSPTYPPACPPFTHPPTCPLIHPTTRSPTHPPICCCRCCWHSKPLYGTVRPNNRFNINFNSNHISNWNFNTSSKSNNIVSILSHLLQGEHHPRDRRPQRRRSQCRPPR